MKKVKSSQSEPDMLDEYDFSHGIRGKYVERLHNGSNVVKLDEDVAAIFPTEKAVNDALRSLAKIIKQHEQSVQVR
ncbi:MAG: hypothetical protein V9G98_13760 [Candidatus Competibacter sp.]